MKPRNFPNRVVERQKRALEYWTGYQVPKDFIDKGKDVIANKIAHAKSQVEILGKKLNVK